MVEAIALGQLEPSDQLRLPTGETVLLREVPEFLRHARPGSLGSITRDQLPGLHPVSTVSADEGGVVTALDCARLAESPEDDGSFATTERHDERD